MIRFLSTAALLALLAGCGDGQPFFDEDGGTVDPGTGTGGDDGDDASGGDNPDGGGSGSDILDTGTTLPPGASSPGVDGSITRLESRGDGNGGLVASVRYIPETDRFVVDGLGFDGANTYSRGDPVGQLGDDSATRPRYAVYEADVTTTDFLTGDQIGQITPYRALFAVSENQTEDGDPRSSFAIVRTGGYTGYGFGGFIYERNGGVTLPTTGQAIFSGGYAGMRVFENRGGLEFTQADMQLAIDFRDFNANDAVRGEIYNRVAYDGNGVAIPLGGEGELILPILRFRVQEGAPSLTEDGELSGTLDSVRFNNGAVEVYEEGTYYGLISGDMTSGDGGEVVGIIVVESEDPRFTGVNAQETGGFILYRGRDN